MPLDRLILIVILVVGAVVVTIWLSAIVLAAFQLPGGFLALIPAAFVGYVVWRVVSDRLNNAEDDHYDRIEK